MDRSAHHVARIARNRQYEPSKAAAKRAKSSKIDGSNFDIVHVACEVRTDVRVLHGNGRGIRSEGTGDLEFARVWRDRSAARLLLASISQPAGISYDHCYFEWFKILTTIARRRA
jgi:hypothetical protein